MKLLLIRHGQTASNVARILDTALPGPPLTDLGRHQADALIETLASTEIATIVASRALRAQQTAAPLAAARGLDVDVRDGIHEVGAGNLEGRGDEDAVAGYVGAFVRWASGDLDARVPGGPSGAETLERFTAVVDDLADAAAREGRDRPASPATVIVSHGAMLRLWVGAVARNVTPEFVRDTPIRNTGLIEVHRASGGDWHAVRWMDHVADDAGALVPSGPLEPSTPGNPGF